MSPHSLLPKEGTSHFSTRTVKFYADGASLEDFTRLYKSGLVSGFTTNPSLMRRAGVADYEAFSKAVLEVIPDMPISFEVFSDDFADMRRQALKIRSWGHNVYVKIPIMNTKGESSLSLVQDLAQEGVKVNVTALLTLTQVADTVAALDEGVPAIISIFAGRIADTGLDPCPIMRAAVALAHAKRKAEILWASTREVLNIHQARECGCHIITAPSDILKKLELTGKDLEGLSRETVQMFYDDATKAGYSL